MNTRDLLTRLFGRDSVSTANDTGPEAETKEQEMTTSTVNLVHFTGELVGASSVVDAARYNENSDYLYVTIGDSVYAYYDVPRSVWSDLLYSFSVGAFYNASVKGHYKSVRFDKSAIQFVPVNQGAGTPKGLSDNRDEVVTTPTTNVFNLSVPEEKASGRSHTVRFVVGDETDLREYSVDARSLDDALLDFNNIAKAMNLPLRVKEVVTYFE